MGALVVTPGGAGRSIIGGGETPGRRSWRLSDDFLAGLPRRLVAAGVPGVCIGLGRPGATRTAHAAGRRGPAAVRGAAPVTPDGVFAAASLSKPVVATIAWTLHRDGVFDVDRPLVDLLPNDVPVGRWAPEMTSRHALQHVSGLPNWRFQSGPLEVAFRPGTAWAYSGEGYVLVQRALETVTGKALERLAREVVFEPLAMASSSYIARPELEPRVIPSFVSPDNRFAAYAALSHWKEKALILLATARDEDPADFTQAGLREIDGELSARAAEMAGREFPATATVPNFIVPNGAGSLRTTAGDYLLLLHHWMTDTALRDLAFSRPARRTDRLSWGAGWGLVDADRGVFWHWGESLGTRALAYADGEAGEALVVLTNGDAGMRVAESVVHDATGVESAIFDVL